MPREDSNLNRRSQSPSLWRGFLRFLAPVSHLCCIGSNVALGARLFDCRYFALDLIDPVECR